MYKPIATVNQNDLEIFIPNDIDSYIDLDIQHYVRGKLVSGVGKDVDLKDTTSVAKNLHSLFDKVTSF